MSLMTMEAVVIDVEIRGGISKKTNQPYTCYDVIDADNNKWVAWEKDLAERAFNLKGVPSVWQVDVTKNDKFTNRTLKAIEAKPAAGYEPALQTMAAQMGGISSSTFSPTVGTPAASPPFDPNGETMFSSEGSNPTYKDRHIWRQTATKVSAQLGGTSDEFWRNTFDLIEFYETGVRPGSLDQLIQSGAIQVGTAGVSVTPWAPPGPEPDQDIPFN